jgi:hypothetical protein
VDRKIHNHYQNNSAFRSQNNACNLTKTTEKRTFHIPSPSSPQFFEETNEQINKPLKAIKMHKTHKTQTQITKNHSLTHTCHSSRHTDEAEVEAFKAGAEHHDEAEESYDGVSSSRTPETKFSYNPPQTTVPKP